MDARQLRRVRRVQPAERRGLRRRRAVRVELLRRRRLLRERLHRPVPIVQPAQQRRHLPALCAGDRSRRASARAARPATARARAAPRGRPQAERRALREPSECTSGFCKDGVCCNNACDGACRTCETGTCANVKRKPDPPECTGTMTCNADREVRRDESSARSRRASGALGQRLRDRARPSRAAPRPRTAAPSSSDGSGVARGERAREQRRDAGIDGSPTGRARRNAVSKRT